MRLRHAPLLHFVAGGSLLFVLVRASGPPPPASGEKTRAPVTVAAADVARLRDDYARETGLAATADDEAALVDQTIDEVLLFREALARGLDRHDRSLRTWLIDQMRILSDDPSGDPDALHRRALELGLDRSDMVVRRSLVQKMRLLAERADERPPTEDELRAFYASQRDAFRAPDRVSFWQIFYASDRGADRRAALARLAALRTRPESPSDAVRFGDSFAAPPHLVGQSQAQIAKWFGAPFASALERGAAGTWIGPVASAYGTHLVWIDARVPGDAPALEAVRGQILERWQSGQRAARRAQLLRDLRAGHELHVESAAWLQRRAS
ncbi:MAG: peptidyl-prolyl cis-trans isomerase [Candidatus Binatia bacterium]